MPKIRFSRRNLAVFAGCWILFWAAGGFSWPENTLHISQEIFDEHALDAWLYCFLMYVFGSVSLSLIEHKIGFLVPVSIRIAYIVIGAGLMGGALIWWHAFKGAL